MIDFAYDTDWTGLRNWTSFLGWFGLSALLGISLSKRPFPFHLLSISRVSICLDGYIDAYVESICMSM